MKRLKEPRGLDADFFDVTFDSDKILSFAKEIGKWLPTAAVVFTSCYVAHAVEIVDAPHIYFLVKPYAADRVRTALEKVKKQSSASDRDYLLLLPMRGYGDVVLPRNRILYLERMHRITVVNCDDIKYETLLKLDQIEELLAAQPDASLHFSRPHNSYLVNLAYVEKIERFCLYLSNGEVLPISNQRRPGFRDDLAAFVNH